MQRAPGGRWWWVGATIALASFAGVTACGSDEQSVTTTRIDWRQAIRDTPRAADADAFCEVLASDVPPLEVRTVVILSSALDQVGIDRIGTAIEQITGAPPRHLTSDEVRHRLEGLFSRTPGVLDPGVLQNLGGRYELAPVDESVRAEIAAIDGVDHVTVAAPEDLTELPTVLDTLVATWPTRLREADLILFVRPALGDGPLDEIEREIDADHAGAAASVIQQTQDDALAEFGRLFADSPSMISSVTAEMLPASIRILGTDEAGLTAIGSAYDADPRIEEVVRMGGSDRLLIPAGRFVSQDLPVAGAPALAALVATAPDELVPDVAVVVETFPDPLRLATTGFITGPGEDVAISRPIWEQGVPAIQAIARYGRETCGLKPVVG